jgi:hypothetical protein
VVDAPEPAASGGATADGAADDGVAEDGVGPGVDAVVGAAERGSVVAIGTTSPVDVDEGPVPALGELEASERAGDASVNVTTENAGT